MKRFLYDVTVLSEINKLKYEASVNKISYDSTYLDFHNHFCPCCEKLFIVFNRFIQQPGTVCCVKLKEKNKMIPYVLCKNCSINLEYSKYRILQKADEYVVRTINYSKE